LGIDQWFSNWREPFLTPTLRSKAFLRQATALRRPARDRRRLHSCRKSRFIRLKACDLGMLLHSLKMRRVVIPRPIVLISVARAD
jgi:hypothetical protein